MTIKERREQLGLQQKDLLVLIRQDESRMDIGTLSRIENGFVLPRSSAVLESICKHLQAAWWDFFTPLEYFAIVGQETHRDANTDAVANALGYGKQNAVTRGDLADRLGVCDRQMRAMIAEAKKNGLVVCTDQDGKGYYIADTDDERKRQYQQTFNRAMSLLVQLKFMREEWA